MHYSKTEMMIRDILLSFFVTYFFAGSTVSAWMLPNLAKAILSASSPTPDGWQRMQIVHSYSAPAAWLHLASMSTFDLTFEVYFGSAGSEEADSASCCLRGILSNAQSS